MGIISRIRNFLSQHLVADDETSKKLDIMDEIGDAIESGPASRAERLIKEYPQYATAWQKDWLAKREGGTK